MKKTKILGREGKNWSIDKDRYFTEKAFTELKLPVTKSILKADIIYSVWYNYIFKSKMLFLYWLRKKIIAVITNDIEKTGFDFDKKGKIIDYWVYANLSQKKFLLEKGIDASKTFYNPYYVDEHTFRKINYHKKVLSEKINIDFSRLKNKIIIGSFQRDSLGNDLSKPKFQKNPQLIINVLKKTDKTKYILLLAGPRRHFIINECRKYKIPYIFVGNESFIDKMKDDMRVNNLPEETINILYNISDIYLITSASEGGPKAVIESSLTKTLVLSTPVGFAPDFLCKDVICKNENDFFKKIESFIQEPDYFKRYTEKHYKNVIKINNWESFKTRIKNITETISDEIQS